MQPSWAYMAVIIIWSTTPLAIKFSNDSLTPLASISLRIVLAVAIACVLLVLWSRKWPLRRSNWPVYLAAAIGLFPNMPLVYVASNYIPSGLVAILFGLTPFVNGLLAIPMLGEPRLTATKWLSLVVAMLGLWVVFSEQLNLGEDAATGIVLMVISVIVFCFSSLLVKRLSRDYTVQPVEQALGSMIFALPGLMLCWWVMDDDFQLMFSEQSLWALLYLAIIGSLLGFVAYFRILKSMSIATVSLIPLMTPVFAVALGAWFAGERVGLSTLLGGGFILIALGFYQGSFSFLMRRISRKEQVA